MAPDPTEKKDSTKDTENASHERNDESGFARVKVDFADRLVREYETQTRETDSRERTKIRLECLTLLAVVVYAAVAILQWCEMRETNGLTQEALVLSTRPYVHVSSDPSTKRIYLYNFGRSPVRTYERGAIAYSPTHLAGGPNALQELPSQLLFPGARDERGTESYGQWVPLQGPQLSPADRVNMETGNGFVYIKAEVDYQLYLTRICTEYALKAGSQLADGMPCSDPYSNCADETCK
jgi:hypothetical protein